MLHLITLCDPVRVGGPVSVNFVKSPQRRERTTAFDAVLSKSPKARMGQERCQSIRRPSNIEHATEQHKLRAWFGILHFGEVHRESLRVRSRPKLLLAHRLPPVHRRRPRHLRPLLRLHLGGAPRRAGVGAVLLTWLGLGLKGYRVIGLQGYRVAGLQGYRVRGLGPGSGFGLGFGPGLLLTNS